MSPGSVFTNKGAGFRIAGSSLRIQFQASAGRRRRCVSHRNTPNSPTSCTLAPFRSGKPYTATSHMEVRSRKKVDDSILYIINLNPEWNSFNFTWYTVQHKPASRSSWMQRSHLYQAEQNPFASRSSDSCGQFGRLRVGGFRGRGFRVLGCRVSVPCRPVSTIEG